MKCIFPKAIAHCSMGRMYIGSNPVIPTKLDKPAEMLPSLFLSSSGMQFRRGIASNTSFTFPVRNALFRENRLRPPEIAFSVSFLF